MTFGLGRTVRYYDMPTVRAIVRNAAKDDYRLSSIILGIVKSDAFQMQETVSPSPATPPARAAALESGSQYK